MPARTLWIIAFLLCIVAVVTGFVSGFRASRGQVLPLLLTVPFVILARLAWRRLRPAA